MKTWSMKRFCFKTGEFPPVRTPACLFYAAVMFVGAVLPRLLSVLKVPVFSSVILLIISPALGFNTVPAA